MKKIFSLVVTIALINSTSVVHAHPGRTDSEGGHTCRTNCTEKWGVEYNSYHFHNKETKEAPKVKLKARQEAKTEAKTTFHH